MGNARAPPYTWHEWWPEKPDDSPNESFQHSLREGEATYAAGSANQARQPGVAVETPYRYGRGDLPRSKRVVSKLDRHLIKAKGLVMDGKRLTVDGVTLVRRFGSKASSGLSWQLRGMICALRNYLDNTSVEYDNLFLTITA